MAKSTIRKSTSETTPTPAARRRTTVGEGAAESTPRVTARPRRKAELPVRAADATRTVAIDTAKPANGTPETEVTHDRIAERAYHLFLQRGGYPGDQFQDWVTAERQLREQSKH